MKKEEIAKKGVSLYSSFQNRKYHKKLSEGMDALNARNRSNRNDLLSLRISLNNLFINFKKLNNYTVSNIKILFNNTTRVEKRLNLHEKRIKEQQSEIEKLKLEIVEIKNKI